MDTSSGHCAYEKTRNIFVCRGETDFLYPTAQFEPDETATAQAMSSILQNLQARASAKSSKNTILPPELAKSISSLVTTSNEFLRQFWFAVLPAQAGDISFAARMSPEEKFAKAQRMISYLAKTEERVQSLVRQGAAMGVKEDKVRSVSAFITSEFTCSSSLKSQFPPNRLCYQ